MSVAHLHGRQLPPSGSHDGGWPPEARNDELILGGWRMTADHGPEAIGSPTSCELSGRRAEEVR